MESAGIEPVRALSSSKSLRPMYYSGNGRTRTDDLSFFRRALVNFYHLSYVARLLLRTPYVTITNEILQGDE
jgi:hypothetical protein